MNCPSNTNKKCKSPVYSSRFVEEDCRRISAPRVRSILSHAIISLLLIASPSLLAREAVAQAPTKRVLVLSGYDPNRPGVQILNRAITSAIRDGSSDRIEFYYEFQENFRIPNAKYEEEMVAYLRQKYAGENISLIIGLGAPSLDFLLKHEPEVFTGIPRVFYFHDESAETVSRLWPRVTGVWAKFELSKTLDLALTLHPNTKRVFVVSGNSGQEKFVREEAQRQFQKYEGKVEFTQLTDLTMNELKDKVASLPEDSIVIYLAFLLDKSGNTFSGPEALSLFAPKSNSPIYGIADIFIGSGIVGGSLLDFEGLGRRTGELGLRVMTGERPQDIAPQTVPNTTQFDWRELKRWGIRESKLPPGSVVRFRQPSFWELYGIYFIGIVAACIIEAALIAWLLVMRARRRQAQGESQRQALIAQTEHRRLNEVVSNVPGIVWESRLDSDKSRNITFVSEYVEKMLGYSVEQWLSTPQFALKIVHEDDRERVKRESEAVFAGNNARVLQFRWVAKDGRIVWVESHLAPIIDQTGMAVGIRGVTLDITDQKLAEAAREESEERNRAILHAIPDLMFLQNREGVYLDYHAQRPQDLLVPPEVFLGKNMRDILPPELAERFFECFFRAEHGKPQIMEYELKLNGSPRWFEARAVLSGDNILTMVRDVTSRKETGDALIRNEAQLAAIIGSAMDGIITIDEGQNIVLFNSAAEKMFYCSAEEAIGQSIDRFIPEELRLAHREHIRQFGEKNITRRLMGLPGDVVGLRTSGEQFPIEASISQIELNGRKFYTVILRDVTERKRAEAKLRASEENYRSIFNAANDAIFIQDIETGAILDANERVCDMYGFSPEEIRHLTVRELSADETPFSEQEAMKLIRSAAVGDPQLFEWKARGKSGRVFWVEVNLRRAFLIGKNVLLAVVRDISERKQTEEALRQSEERFRNMADTAPVMIWVSDPDKQCTYVNKKWLDFTGHTFEQELGAGWTEGIHPDDYANCLRVFTSAFDRREAFKMEYRLRQADGKYRWVFDSGAPRFASDGEFLGFIGSCMDITERKESEEALRTAHYELNQLKNQLEAENIYLQAELQLGQSFGEIVGQSDEIKYVHFKISEVAPTDSTVLIMGDTGTGKELVARAIHQASKRRDRPLIKVNCAALTASLIESELFGHEKGAFTGAASRKLGRFELANGGTIFLDEIGELPLESQVKLLRVIQEGEIERLGGTKTINVDVRIIAATNRNLKAEVDKGTFRQDLWYRLNVFPITIPPLKQRKEDVPLLVDHFVAKCSRKFGKNITSVPANAMRSLQEHSWPGNVRELANVIERAVIHTQGSVLNLADRFDQTPEEQPSQSKSLEEVEREHIIRTLEQTGWRIEGPYGAAKILGLNPSTLRTRMAKLQIQKRHASHV
jgi:PAS domain S-box-containing protein